MLMLYKPKSEHARMVEEYAQEFMKLHPGSEVTLRDVDSTQGSDQAQLYDIVEYPALLIIASDGSLISMWSGEHLPLMDEVAGYTRA